MTFSLAVASALLGHVPFQNAVKKDFPNGAVAIARRTDSPGRYRVSLALNSAAFPEGQGSTGARHMLEHILAKGPGKDFDRRLESQGCRLVAETDRDASVFTIYGPSSTLPLAFAVLKELCGPMATTPEEIAREVEIIRQEQILHEGFRPFLDKAWEEAYGISSPSGDLAFLAKQTPETLALAKQKVFAGRAIALTVVGDIDVAVAVSRCEELLQGLPAGDLVATRRDANPPSRSTAPGRGGARAVPVGGLGEARTLALLAVALKASDADPHIQVAYDPSAWPGVVLAHSPSGSQTSLDAAFGKPDSAGLGRARQLVTAWAHTFLSVENLRARTEAKLPFQYSTLALDKLPGQAAGLTDDELVRAWTAWGGSHAYTIRGGRL